MIYKYKALLPLRKDIRTKAVLVCESLEKMASSEPFDAMEEVLSNTDLDEKDIRLLTSHFMLACSESKILQMAMVDICRNILNKHDANTVHTGRIVAQGTDVN
jgi:hypothetical protein